VTVYGAGERRHVDGQDADSCDAHLRGESQRSTERRDVTDHVSFRRRRRTQGLVSLSHTHRLCTARLLASGLLSCIRKRQRNERRTAIAVFK